MQATSAFLAPVPALQKIGTSSTSPSPPFQPSSAITLPAHPLALLLTPAPPLPVPSAGSSRRAPAVRTSMMVDGFQDMSSVLLALNKANDVRHIHTLPPNAYPRHY